MVCGGETGTVSGIAGRALEEVAAIECAANRHANPAKASLANANLFGALTLVTEYPKVDTAECREFFSTKISARLRMPLITSN